MYHRPVTILQRYALKQFVVPFLLAIVVLAFVLLMDRLFLLADLLVRKGVPVLVVGEVMMLSLPFVASVCTPLGSLISGVITYGRMAQDNEIRVVRAAGIRGMRIFLPTVIACAILMVAMVGFNSWVVPESQHRVRNLLTDVARKKPALRMREGVFMNDFSGYMIYIGSIDERNSRVERVAIFERRKANKEPGFVTAPRGEISYTPDDRYMILTLYDGEMHEIGDGESYRRMTFTRHVINVRMDEDLVRRDREYRSDQELMLPQLIVRIGELRGEKAEIQERVDEAEAKAHEGEAQRLKFEELETRARYKQLEIARYETELYKKMSLAFSCFFFLLFGAPLGILLRRGGIGTGFIVGLVFFAVYYVLLLAGQNLADSGRLPPLVGTWLPNILLVPAVVELGSRAFFERPVFWRFRVWRSGSGRIPRRRR